MRELPRFVKLMVAPLLLAALVLVRSAPARAAEADEAESLIREGVQLRAQDNAAKALPLFEKAYQISRTPRTAAQLGLCELDLRSYAAAERHLAEALATPSHPWIAKNKATLKKQLETARASVGELALTVSPASAEVSVNGKLVDKTLLGALRLDKGSAEVEVRAQGYQPARETIPITGGKREQRTYALSPDPVQPPAFAAATATAPPPAAVAPSEPGAAVTLTASPTAPAGETNTRRLAAWITGGAAVGMLAFGTVEAFNAASKRDAFNAHTGVVGGVVTPDCATASLSGACKPLKDAYDQALTMSIVGFVAAGALAATSSVLFVLSAPGQGGNAGPEGGAHALACVPDLGARGLACSLRF